MSEMISKDQAATALALAFQFEGALEMKPSWEAFNANATTTGTRYAMVEIAAVVDEIFLALPESGKELLAGDVFYAFVLDRFNFPEDGTTPTLIGTVDDAVAFFVEEFELEADSSPAVGGM